MKAERGAGVSGKRRPQRSIQGFSKRRVPDGCLRALGATEN